MKARTTLLFILIAVCICLAFVLDIVWGATSIPIGDVLKALSGSTDTTYNYIVQNFRLPKALATLFVGAGVAISGLQMQSLFRNPLADISILGINSGAGVGVAVYTMAYTLFPSLIISSAVASSWGIIVAACLGSVGVLLVISLVASRLGDMISILIVGVMIGFLASSVISVLQFFSSEATLKTYLLWSFGSVSGVTWRQLSLMLPVIGLGLGLSMLMPKQMNALNLGEHYARSVGTNVTLARVALVGITSLVTGCITAFVGPIAFLGIAVPHFVRTIFCTADHHILIPATMLSGALLLLICDIFTQVPGYQFVLPINALTSLLGAPVVIWVIMRGRKNNQVFR